MCKPEKLFCVCSAMEERKMQRKVQVEGIGAVVTSIDALYKNDMSQISCDPQLKCLQTW